jgi:prepilin-type N-terminal cleavage/methylation domain-containing protein/prepilin-type processing-associated H-X9-DG protein
MTLIELMVVVALMALLAGLYLPAIHRVKAKGLQTRCLGNLRQIGIGFRLFADDHENHYPMTVATGGTKEFVNQGETWRHYLALSNYLSEPKLLLCPADRQMSRAPNWQVVSNQNISYFVGVDATFGNATHFLSGDRNIASDRESGTNIYWLNRGEEVSWTQDLHDANGNILFADNHVEMLNDEGLRLAVRRSITNNR